MLGLMSFWANMSSQSNYSKVYSAQWGEMWSIHAVPIYIYVHIYTYFNQLMIYFYLHLLKWWEIKIFSRPGYNITTQLAYGSSCHSRKRTVGLNDWSDNCSNCKNTCVSWYQMPKHLFCNQSTDSRSKCAAYLILHHEQTSPLSQPAQGEWVGKGKKTGREYGVLSTYYMCNLQTSDFTAANSS